MDIKFDIVDVGYENEEQEITQAGKKVGDRCTN